MIKITSLQQGRQLLMPHTTNDPSQLPNAALGIDAVVIGRNEGARLLACLRSLSGQVNRVIYVDSGSTDGSPDQARALGAVVVDLDMNQPFTAARARNVGLALCTRAFVQFVDGDCIVEDGWITTAAMFLTRSPQVAAVCGRRQEIHPEASVFNRLCDREWDTPVGQALACGGDVLMRRSAVTQMGGYRDDLIAGEEPELCVRLRAAGWDIWRLDAPMTRHDANMTRFGQWWTRTRRAGHAYAEGAALHGAPPERHWVRETRRATIWGGGRAGDPSVRFPVAGLLAAAIDIPPADGAACTP